MFLPGATAPGTLSVHMDLITTPPQLPPRRREMHKGDAGRVALVAGSPGMSGAAMLCGLGALRVGAGLVRIVTDAAAQPIIASMEPSFMTSAAPKSPDRDAVESFGRDAILAYADAIGIGPGLGATGPVPTAIIPLLLRESDRPLVLDADALNFIAGLPQNAARVERWWEWRAGRPTVLTPHPGEMARLREGAGLERVDDASAQGRLDSAAEVARLTNAIVVLKGVGTVVTDGERAYINSTGNPGMATGGMGDVLTGVITALIAQGMTPFDAACLGVWAHGAAADECARAIGAFGYLAREVADALPRVLGASSR